MYGRNEILSFNILNCFHYFVSFVAIYCKCGDVYIKVHQSPVKQEYKKQLDEERKNGCENFKNFKKYINIDILGITKIENSE